MLSQDTPINYDLLAKATQFYRGYRFKQIEVPWLVDSDSSMRTAPSKDVCFVVRDGRHLVGSAEQGFIELSLEKLVGYGQRDKIELGQNYFAVSPCFRNEKLDDTHSKWFMKLELYSLHDTQIAADVASNNFLTLARDFFWEVAARNADIEKTDTGFDLSLGGLEVGSYGTRVLKTIWGDGYAAYGTGIALPRFQIALERAYSGLP